MKQSNKKILLSVLSGICISSTLFNFASAEEGDQYDTVPVIQVPSKVQPEFKNLITNEDGSVVNSAPQDKVITEETVMGTDGKAKTVIVEKAHEKLNTISPDSINNEFANVADKIKGIGTITTTLTKNIDTNTKDLSDVHKSIDAINTKEEALRKDINKALDLANENAKNAVGSATDINHSINELKKVKANKEHIDTLNKTVSSLETAKADLTYVDSKIKAISETVEKDLTQIKNVNNQQDSDINSLKGRLNLHDSKLESMGESVEKTFTNIDGKFTKKVNEISSAILNVANAVDTENIRQDKYIADLNNTTTEMGAAVTTLAKAVDSENARQDADITTLNTELARIDLKTKYTVDDVNALSVKEAKLADKTEAINKSVANLTKTVTDNKTAQDTAVAELNGKFATVDEYAKNVASALTDLEETVKQENDNQNKRVMDLRYDHEALEDTVNEVGSAVTTLAKAVDTENARQDRTIDNLNNSVVAIDNAVNDLYNTVEKENGLQSAAIRTNGNRIADNKEELNKLNNRYSEHDSKINNHDRAIVTLQTRQNDAQNSRAENAKAIKALDTKTDATNNRVNALEAGAEKLNTSVNEIMALNATQSEAIAKLDKTQAADRATVKEDLAKVNSTISTTVATINADLKAVQSNVTTENARQDEAISQNMAAITSLKNATTANMSAALAPVNSKNAMQDTAIANNLKAINSLQDTTKTINATTAEIGAAVTAVATAVDSENARQDQAIENCNARLEDHKNAIAATAVLAYKNKDAIKALSDEIVEAYGGTPETEEADTSMLLPGHVFATVNGKVETVKKASKPGELMAAERAETANHFAKVDATNARQDAQISSLRTDLERTGADSAALAALKPLPTDAKNQVMVGAGHYRGKTSFAMGLAYRPNEDFMAHVGTTLSDSHAMINTGVTFAIGSGKVAHRNDEIKALKERIEVLEQQIQELLAAK